MKKGIFLARINKKIYWDFFRKNLFSQSSRFVKPVFNLANYLHAEILNSGDRYARH